MKNGMLSSRFLIRRFVREMSEQKKKWLRLSARTLRCSAAECRFGNIFERILHRCSQTHGRMGRRIPCHFPHRFQNNRRNNKRCNGLHNRPHAHSPNRAKSRPWLAFGAACRDNGHSAFPLPQKAKAETVQVVWVMSPTTCSI